MQIDPLKSPIPPARDSLRLPFDVRCAGNSHGRAPDMGCADYLLIHTTRGAGLVKNKEREYLISPDHAALLCCSDFELRKTDGSDLWEFKWICFGGICAKTYHDLLNAGGLKLIDAGDAGNIGALFDEISEVLSTDRLLPELKAADLLTRLLTLMILSEPAVHRRKKRKAHDREIQRAIDYIVKNYHRKIDLDSLSEVTHLSKYYLIGVFREYTGLSPYEYLIRHRVSVSKKLLTGTDLSIQEIALKTGFTDANSLIRGFKRVVGITPNKFRNRPLP